MQPPWVAHLERQLEHELLAGSPANPFRPAVLRWALATGRTVDAGPFLDQLERAVLGGRGGARRYRWSFPVADWVPQEQRLAWRPAEHEQVERSGGDQAARLWTPPILAEHVDLLERLAHAADVATAARARALLGEATPRLEDDVARRVLGADPWGDTFLLWVFSRRSRALTAVRGLVSAIAARYAARAARTGGIVEGITFPFFEQPMPSATAHLAAAAARMGEGIDLVAPAVAWLAEQRRPDGGWGDPDQPSDLLTTLAVAELLGTLDPAFSPAAALDAIGAILARQDGRVEVMGPEWPWVAVELVMFARWSALPFQDRFRWPHMADWVIDRRVRVPRYEAYLLDARLFERLPGLGAAAIEISFLDMAGFGAWNSTYGQAAGDELLALLTAQLRTIPSSRTIRDGGDEFLVLGAPGAAGLEDRLGEVFRRWPGVSRAAYPDLAVVPLRAAITTTTASDLLEARVRLGAWIGDVKRANPSPAPEGVITRFG